MFYRIAPFLLISKFFTYCNKLNVNAIFRTVPLQFQDFNRHQTSRGPSAVDEPPVIACIHGVRESLILLTVGYY